ncbi:hypothetical protein [Parasitella parasitica]|uniref:Uncharacterized protein n=1 Tax=Parasitella parasitica TaxID=35722 RepID=A0A0B7MUI0_9FUNG|nr:hypothetical protein [Parasitella parasitica]
MKSLLPEASTSPLVAALYGHLEATIYLVQVALKLEWTIFSRLVAVLMFFTMAYISYILITLRHGRHPLMIWEKLGKPVVKNFRPWTFARLLNNSDPYARSIDMRVSTFSRGFCTAIMRYKKTARGLLTASSDYTLPSDLEEGRHEIKTEVVVKDRMLDTVAIGYLVWSIETKEA